MEIKRKTIFAIIGLSLLFTGCSQKGNLEHTTYIVSGRYYTSGEVITEDGNVWGRGTVDTKASLFCMLQAVEELIKDGFEPECDVYIASSCTEEWSGDGAPATVQYLKDNGVVQ